LTGGQDDLAKFSVLGTALADQYSALEPLPGVHVDGNLPLVRYRRFRWCECSLRRITIVFKKQSKTKTLMALLLQRFFISWTTVWRTKSRDEAIKIK
jgi:endothelin-converting enzyme/putative endopeptidase